MKPVDMREIEPGVFVPRREALARQARGWLENTAIVAAVVGFDFAMRGESSAPAVVLRGIHAWLA